MALSTSNKITLFVILNKSYTGTVDKPLGDFDLTFQAHYPASLEQDLKTKINSRLDALDTDEETWLIEQINHWKMYDASSATMTDGAVGSIAGVNFDPEKEQSKIKRNILHLIPVYRYRQELMSDYDIASESTFISQVTSCR